MDDGDVRVLNVGAGDIKLLFDKSNPAERIRAARIVTDMLRRGFALLVEVGRGDDGRPIYQRAHAFDEEKCEYIIADYDPLVGQRADADEAAGIERLTMSRVEAGATEGTEVTAHAGDDGEAAAAGGGEDPSVIR